MSDPQSVATGADAELDQGFRFRIADITPVPDDDVIAAITAALHEAWPQPAIAAAPLVAANTNWRFGERRWNDRQIPRRTWGRAS